jgi:hypothetical protein
MSTKPPSSEKDAPEDFWDLGDDDLDVNLPALEEAQRPGPIEEPSELEEVAEAHAAELEQHSGVQEEELPTAGDDLQESGGEPGSSAGSIGQWLKTLSIIEKASLLILIACLAGAAIWGVSSYYKEAPQGQLITFDENFPVKGAKITAAEVETWWRRPIRSGANVDRGVVIEANLIPCARIKLQDSGSTTLQVTFRNGKRDLIGDPITLTVEAGKFTSTNSDEITINSTSGFSSASDLNAYTNGDIDPWSIMIEESDDSSNGDEPFLRVRIDPTYKED